MLVNNLKKIVNKNPLFFAFFFPALVDGVVTLLGQGPQYWTNTRTVNEASPAYYFLLTSPWLFIFGGIVWFIFWYFVFKTLKEPLNLFLMFLFIAGHSWGSTGWIQKILKQMGVYTIGDQISIIFSWSLLVLYFVLTALISTYFLKVYLKSNLARK